MLDMGRIFGGEKLFHPLSKVGIGGNISWLTSGKFKKKHSWLEYSSFSLGNTSSIWVHFLIAMLVYWSVNRWIALILHFVVSLRVNVKFSSDQEKYDVAKKKIYNGDNAIDVAVGR